MLATTSLADVADVPGLRDALLAKKAARRTEATVPDIYVCVQCNRPIHHPHTVELVIGSNDEPLPLHKGGCPS